MVFWKRYWQLVRAHQWGLWISLGLIGLVSVINLAPTALLKVFMDRTQEMASGQPVGVYDLVGIALTWVGVQFVSDIVDPQSSRRVKLLEMELMETLRRTVYQKLISLPMAYHTREHTGKKTSVVGSGAQAVSDITMTVFYQFVPVIMKSVLAFGTLIWLWWPLAVGITPILVVSFAKAYRMRKQLQAGWKIVEDEGARFAALSDDVLTNISTVQTYGQGGRLVGELVTIRDRIFGHERSMVDRHVPRDVWRNMSLTFAYGLVFLVCAWRISQGLMTLGTFAFAYAMARDLAMQTVGLERSFMNFGRYKEKAERLFQMLDHPIDVSVATNPVAIRNLRGSVTLERVNFTYPEGGGTLREVDVRIAAGSTVAVVGKSGAGKSTLIQLILRLYDPDAGRVLVDGKDLREVDLDQFRSQVGYVQQRVDLFNQTMAWNIAFGKPEATQAEIQEAARLAGIHDFIVSQPQGYETIVGERGVTLSGGQAQRLVIARALLPNPRIVIFDEATSALDGETEAEIQDAIERIRGGRTVIVIAHRLSTIRIADQVIVLEAGRVVQSGSYNILARETGLFRSMLARQLQLPIEGEA